jgi:hypothetical protein
MAPGLECSHKQIRGPEVLDQQDKGTRVGRDQVGDFKKLFFGNTELWNWSNP